MRIDKLSFPCGFVFEGWATTKGQYIESISCPLHGKKCKPLIPNGGVK